MAQYYTEFIYLVFIFIKLCYSFWQSSHFQFKKKSPQGHLAPKSFSSWILTTLLQVIIHDYIDYYDYYHYLYLLLQKGKSTKPSVYKLQDDIMKPSTVTLQAVAYVQGRLSIMHINFVSLI